MDRLKFELFKELLRDAHILRSFDVDIDEHPMQWCLERMTDELMPPLCVWLDEILDQERPFCPDLTNLIIPASCLQLNRYNLVRPFDNHLAFGSQLFFKSTDLWSRMSTCQTPHLKTMIGCASPLNLVEHFGTWLFETFPRQS